jgi:hypothetical protein
MRTEFVGREREIAVLVESLAAARAGVRGSAAARPRTGSGCSTP